MIEKTDKKFDILYKQE